AGYKSRGDRLGESRALANRLWLFASIAPVEMLTVAEEAVRVLGDEPPGPDLARAYQALAQAHTILGDWHQVFAAADRAVTITESVDLTIDGDALHHRGLARVWAQLDEPDVGFAEMDLALTVLLK